MKKPTKRYKRIFIVFVSAFLGVILLAGAIFGAVSIVRESRSVMKYKGVYLNSGVSNYLISSYKYDFMIALKSKGIVCRDTESFWQSEARDGQTYGEMLADETALYLKRVIIGSYLFDKNTRLNKNDKDVIEKAVEDVLIYRADGDKAKFNDLSRDMGFTYSDFEKAAEMLYKYEMAESVIFGFDGEALASGSFTLQCDEYFEKSFSRVMLMFVRTDGEYVTNPETGKQEFSKYDESLKAKAEAEIDEIRTLIYNAENNVQEEQMSATSFVDWYINKKYPTGTVNDTSGYYFSRYSSYTNEFYKDASSIVELAFSTEIGHYAEAVLDFGVCFIYRCELEEGAYQRDSIKHFFGDFYDDAATYLYFEAIDFYLPDVTVKEKYDHSSVIGIPYNQEFSIKFG